MKTRLKVKEIENYLMKNEQIAKLYKGYEITNKMFELKLIDLRNLKKYLNEEEKLEKLKFYENEVLTKIIQ